VVCTEEDEDGKSVLLKGGQLFTLKETMLHFLLQLNEDFDDDLLQDAIELTEHC
jgi:hypothetical protein